MVLEVLPEVLCRFEGRYLLHGLFRLAASHRHSEIVSLSQNLSKFI
jgi:hypothetical protein